MPLSNVLLWQISYAEVWVTPTCWPEFERRAPPPGDPRLCRPQPPFRRTLATAVGQEFSRLAGVGWDKAALAAAGPPGAGRNAVGPRPLRELVPPYAATEPARVSPASGSRPEQVSSAPTDLAAPKRPAARSARPKYWLKSCPTTEKAATYSETVSPTRWPIGPSSPPGRTGHEIAVTHWGSKSGRRASARWKSQTAVRRTGSIPRGGPGRRPRPAPHGQPGAGRRPGGRSQPANPSISRRLPCRQARAIANRQ